MRSGSLPKQKLKTLSFAEALMSPFSIFTSSAARVVASASINSFLYFCLLCRDLRYLLLCKRLSYLQELSRRIVFKPHNPAIVFVPTDSDPKSESRGFCCT